MRLNPDGRIRHDPACQQRKQTRIYRKSIKPVSSFKTHKFIFHKMTTPGRDERWRNIHCKCRLPKAFRPDAFPVIEQPALNTAQQPQSAPKC